VAGEEVRLSLMAVGPRYLEIAKISSPLFVWDALRGDKANGNGHGNGHGEVKELTLIDANTNGSLILALDDPRLFKYPIAYMWEPGFWTMSEVEALRFREYLQKGGFAIFDDFEREQWNNFEAQMRRVLPEARWVKLDRSHPIFDSFFRMKTIEFPHPMYGFTPSYYGIYEDNDPRRRLMVVANHDNDVAEYWEWSGRGLFPVDASNEAYKLGVNYMLYGLTH